MGNVQITMNKGGIVLGVMVTKCYSAIVLKCYGVIVRWCYSYKVL